MLLNYSYLPSPEERWVLGATVIGLLAYLAGRCLSSSRWSNGENQKANPSRNLPENVIGAQLARGEWMIWAGAPQRGLLLRRSDAAQIPFSLMWGGFAIFWEMNVLSTNAPLMFKLWGVPFVAIGLYLIAGRFFVNAWLRARTYYGLTNQRILVVSERGLKKVTSISLRNLPEMSYTEHGKRVGSISFGPDAPLVRWTWQQKRAVSPLMFEFIPNARAVYEMIRSAELAADDSSK